jgi:5-(carboxyamino)imidazole ribonucleotide synthase
MLALAGAPLDEPIVFLDPNAESPGGHVGELIVGAYDDPKAIEALAAHCKVATYEFESVPVSAVRGLEEHGVEVFPPAGALEVAQDRFLEKSFFAKQGIPTAGFARIDTREELAAAAASLGLPAVLKTRRFGYDGKGQVVLRDAFEVDAAWEAVRQAPSILEQFVRFERELSILVVRGKSGEVATYPLVENHHAGGILRVSYAPAPNVSAALQARAAEYAEKVARELAYVGVLAIEFFVGKGPKSEESLVANEMAPRVHNSGHWTIEGAETSQFENHLRAVLGLPLGGAACVGASAMVNLIGKTPSREAVLAIPGAHLHLYGKEPAPGRKIGHVTVRGASHADIKERVAQVRALAEA